MAAVATRQRRALSSTTSCRTKHRLFMGRCTMNSNKCFGEAVAALKAGHRVSRSGWNGKGLWLELQVPDEHSKMTLPYIFLNYPDDAANTPGARVPWVPSMTDILANDWQVV
ncbi:TPA: DUF2829 domain-containing protein [Klebsiella pneumoniae]|nr:DUF2829 domain-containing protein [Klebsiella pneumoniae]